MPSSTIVNVRLYQYEIAMLKAVCISDVRGDLNEAELIRLLLHREYSRRHNLPKPEPRDYQTAFRIGRPVKISAGRDLSSASGSNNNSENKKENE